jgi:hypothetical protein
LIDFNREFMLMSQRRISQTNLIADSSCSPALSHMATNMAASSR